MHSVAIGVALLVAAAIIIIGLMYLTNPRGAVRSFGLPLPEAGAQTDWWLRLKGVRDVVSGLVLLALVAWSERGMLGIAMLILALIPFGDMSLILIAKGSKVRAFGIHGVTAALLLAAGAALPVTG